MVGRRHCGALLLLLAALATAQLNDEPTSEQHTPHVAFEKENELWRPEEQLQKHREDQDFPIVIFRLLSPSQADDRSDEFSRLDNRQYEVDPQENFLYAPPKRGTGTGVQGVFHSPINTGVSFPRPQKKWKSKKGKKGSSLVCYFKLCAFRPVT